MSEQSNSSPASKFPAQRCRYLSPKGRQCRTLVPDPSFLFCNRHSQLQPNGPDDVANLLFQRSGHFQNAQGINLSLSALYLLLASDRISPRRASTLAYISSLLLRSLPSIDSDLHPYAGLTCTRRSISSADRPGCVAHPNHQSENHPEPAPLDRHAGSATKPLPPGTRPLPPTRAEFAEMVLAAVEQNGNEHAHE